MINFPVLQRVKVSNFALYAGTDAQPGLDHCFVPGVNVIVGINGLGKTTLLTMLLRALSGAVDVPGDDELGDKRRRIVPVDRFWFRKRAPDDAVNAQVTIWFTLGDHHFEVTRSLANLDVVELSVDQQPFPASRGVEMEAAYREQVMTASGLSSFEDFVFLLRYIVFYLEDRRSLVWDAAAQGDVLGILVDELGERRGQYVELFNELLSKDSEYRNVHAVVYKRRKEFNKQTSTIEGGQLERLVQLIEERGKDMKALVARKNESAQTRDQLREQIENRRQEIHDGRSALATQLNSFYESFFPQLDSPARYLLAHFEAGAGCLVCGTQTPEATERVVAKLYMNTCPVCGSPIEKGHRPTNDPHAGEAIEHQRAAITAAEIDLAAMEQPLRDAEQDYSSAAAELVSITSQRISLEGQLKALGDNLPNVIERRNELNNTLLTFEAALNQLEVERIELAGKFRELTEAIDQEVRAVSGQIEQAFAKYIRGFLAEQCEIKYTPRVRRLGQRANTDLFTFPHFIPALTSGVHRNITTVREAGQSVSESQKEFIDLAFRMALLEFAAPSAPTMLILETPESSLDSVFVPRAADLLRRFATRSDNARETRLIASSNVNREQMIPALFGAYPDKRFYGQVVDETPSEMPPMIPVEERASHVLDLLTVAVPTRALERFRTAYEEERDQAIYPDVPQDSPQI
ncbi:AAA family ATPase [Acidovorax sp.]|uniref:AAA family ATPase n=1 Tax=Acidovorax sp. TaxID=1872122 RepID=UPI00391F353B